MKALFPAGRFRSLCCAALLLCALPTTAYAVSWQWSPSPGGNARERVTILLDNANQQARTQRDSEQSLHVELTPAATDLKQSGQSDGQGSLVAGAELDNGGLTLRLSSPAFGFIATRPAADRLVLEIFRDPLGNRWQPDGKIAPPATSIPPAAAMMPPPGDQQAPIKPASPAPQATAPPATTQTPPTPAPKTSSVAGKASSSPAPVADRTKNARNTTVSSNAVSAGTPDTAQASVPVPGPMSEKINNSNTPTHPTPTSPEVTPSAPNPARDTAPPAPMVSNIPVPAKNLPPSPTIRAPLNLAGPEAWPQSKELSSTPASPQATAASPADTAPTSAGSPAEVPVDSPTASPDAPALPPGPEPTPANVEPTSAAPSQDKVEPTAGASPEAPAMTPVTENETNEIGEASATPPETSPSPPQQQKTGATDNQDAALQAVYVDEEGNPVPPPPDVPALLKTMRAQMRGGAYHDALTSLSTLKNANLNRDEREAVLYNIMTAKFELYRPSTFAGHEEELVDAANEAMNFNLDSPRMPAALSVLTAVNLATGNVADAKGYVYLMRRKYPNSPNVSIGFLDLGQKQMERQEYADATISFQTILQEYPESKVAKDAARLQTYALYKQGHRQRAMTLIDFVERRWPRVYLEDPDYLAMTADIETSEGRLTDALNTYWTQYNLDPDNPQSAPILQHIGDLYYKTGQPDAAGKVLEELIRAFPQSREAPQALLWIGENGIHDGNLSVDELFTIFETPNPRLPSLYYQRIIKEYPDAPELVAAKLRTIAWQLWNKEYLPAMNAARAFMIDYEDKPESLRAKDILLRGFAHELGNALAEENFERVLSLWERFPQVHDYYQPLEPDLRVALARAQLNRGKEAEGMELLAPFLDGPEDPHFSLYAYNLYLASYLRAQNWDGILSLGEKVAPWNLPDETRNQLDYAMALSAENLGLQARSLPLWQKLAPQTNIPLYQRAYAAYFLARDAERRQDLRDAYQYNLDALGMFTQLQDDQSPYADRERIRESIAALMDVTEIAGRYAEALDWANKYAPFVPEDSPDYSGLRFREARLHHKMGDTARWRAILQGIIDKEPDSVFGKMAASELHTQDVARDLTRFTGQ